jgi:hypothetical protein
MLVIKEGQFMDYATNFANDFTELDYKYKMVEDYVQQSSQGIVKGLIVNGPPGVGKTFAVKNYLETHCQFNYKIISGQVTMLALYMALYTYRQQGRVLVLDDADSAYKDVIGLNLLKSACDSRAVRNIHWESNAKMAVPNSFDFEGSVILVSNVGFGGNDRKLSAHLDALKDRCHILYVAPGGNDSLFKQICYMVIHHKMLKDWNFTAAEEQMLLEYIETNLNRLHKISLRAVVKLADTYAFAKKDWRQYADQALLKVGV